MISSATISKLIKNGTYITFFEPNGIPVGTIRPFGDQYGEDLKKKQLNISHYRYAIEIAKGSIKSRLVYISSIEMARGTRLFYEGEMEFLHASLDELPYLITLEEIRRMFLLMSDMYYEIISRDIPPTFGFRRRNLGVHKDPINAMLSFGYSMLYGNCCISLIGAKLDPDFGVIHEGRGALVQDLIDPLKSSMIDPVVFRYARESLIDTEYDLEPGRCILSDGTISELICLLHKSINNAKIDEQVRNFRDAIQNDLEFRVLY